MFEGELHTKVTCNENGGLGLLAVSVAGGRAQFKESQLGAGGRCTPAGAKLAVLGTVG